MTMDKIDKTKEAFSKVGRKLRDTPDNLRLAIIGAWRGRERGMAVFAGVFLASLVITTVLSYGVGLSQVFFEGSLEINVFDAKVEFQKAPAENTDGWSNNTTHLVEVCGELVAMEEFNDCTVIFGKKGIHSALDFGNEDIFKAMPLLMQQVNSTDELRNWDSNNIWDYEYTTGPPIVNTRAISFLGPGAFDGVLADRLSENIIYDMGEWVSPEEMEAQRGVYIPSDIASESDAVVGDKLDFLTFNYYTESDYIGEIEDDECAGELIFGGENGYIHCQFAMTVENLTILGIYEPWPQGNPTLAANPIYSTWSVLNESQRITLINYDHVYLGITLDRSLLPTSSTDDAADWLEALGRDVQEDTYHDGEIKLYYVDIISGTILFLNIFLGLIQAFDYIIMVPIVILSLSVLIYGLILSLEQRKREISIHRVIGATSGGLRGMVLLELAVIASIAWFIGYLLAMAAVPIVLASVGFLQFKPLGYSVNPAISFGATIFTALATIGLALIFGRSRTRDFMELEIDEGVSRIQKVGKPKVWLHWTLFLVGSLGAIDTWMEMNGSEDGILTNWFVEGLINIFGPFMLWIGGALILGRLGAAGPKIMQFFLSRTPLLSDVKRGLKGSGSTESVNRLAVIMLLTLSIVTLAAVQGYTGTLVDERTADVTVGSDLQLITTDTKNASEVEAYIAEISGQDVTINAVHVPQLALTPEGGETLVGYVLLNETDTILRWLPQAIPGEDISNAMQGYQNGGFTAGEDAAYKMDLWGSGRGGSGDSGDILLDVNSENTDNITFIWDDIQIEYIENDSIVQPNLLEIFEGYRNLMESNWSNLDLSNQDLSGRDFGRADFSNTNLSGANLQGANLSEALLSNVDLTNTNLADANLQHTVFVIQSQSLTMTNFSNANLNGAYEFTGQLSFEFIDSIENATCPNGTLENGTNCNSGFVNMPPPLVGQFFISPADFRVTTTSYNTTLRYIGTHEFIPGISTDLMESSVIIGESGYRALVGDELVDNLSATTWFVSIPDVTGEDLMALRASIEADSRFESALDWETKHEEVERNGGLIFGTPGLLSLQFIVASVAAVASAFVFLSLVLNQRQKELAVLQAIGASPNQIIRLVLFEILSIIVVSMALGVLLGMGLALSFNGLFNVFGFIFQLLGGTSESVISRELVWPWLELGIVALAVFASVVMALLITTRKALRSDLASVLKGE